MACRDGGCHPTSEPTDPDRLPTKLKYAELFKIVYFSQILNCYIAILHMFVGILAPLHFGSVGFSQRSGRSDAGASASVRSASAST